MCGELERRFEPSDLATIRDIETILLKAANGEDKGKIPHDVVKSFREKNDPGRLNMRCL